LLESKPFRFSLLCKPWLSGIYTGNFFGACDEITPEPGDHGRILGQLRATAYRKDDLSCNPPEVAKTRCISLPYRFFGVKFVSTFMSLLFTLVGLVNIGRFD